MTRLAVWLLTVSLTCVVACSGDDNGITVGNGNNPNNPADAGDTDNASQNNTNPADAGDNADPGDTDNVDPPDMRVDDVGADQPESDDVAVDLPRSEEMGADMTEPACPPQNIGYRQPCDCDQACLSGLCLDETATSAGICSRTCTTRDDCPVGDNACVFDEDLQEGVCRFDETGATCDSSGDPMPSLCDIGICLRGGSSFMPAHFCTIECETSADCKMGHACTPARCKEGSTGDRSCIPTIVAHRAGDSKQTILAAFPADANLCIPVGEVLGGDGWCTAAASNQFACASAVCDDDADRCTGQCLDTDDCPSGGCVDLDVSDPNLPIRVCDFPPA